MAGRLLLKRPEQLPAAMSALTDVVAALGPYRRGARGVRGCWRQ